MDPSKAKKVADKILIDWSNICKRLRIKHFLWYGTCLGLVREHRYIKWDNDLDVGVLCTHKQYVALTTLLKRARFKPAAIFGGNHRWGQMINQHFWRNKVLLDIYVKFGRHRRFLQQFDTVAYNGHSYTVPHPVEQYLTAQYGNWRKPSRSKGKT